MYRHQTLIVILNFTKIINWFLKSDWLITMLFQGQQRCWPRNTSHSAISGCADGHNNRCVSSALFQLFFTSLMKKSMITVRLQYTNINSARALLLAAEEVTFFFFHLISRSHFSHPNFTNCKLHTHMLTDTDLWRVRCYPIDSGITHKVKKTRVGSRVLGSRVLREDLYCRWRGYFINNRNTASCKIILSLKHRRRRKQCCKYSYFSYYLSIYKLWLWLFKPDVTRRFWSFKCSEEHKKYFLKMQA